MRNFSTLIFILFITYNNAYSQITFESFIEKDLDSLVLRGIEQWKIPGIAVAVVKDGNLVYNKGFGIKSIHTKSNVDSDTPFMIGSLTKAITCTTILLAEERGELSSKDLIKKHLPEFEFTDKHSSSLLDVEDFLTGRNGFGSHQGDFLFWKTKLDRKNVLSAVKKFKTASIRKKFTYNNLSYMILGEMLESATKLSWEENVQQFFFKPIGMQHSVPSSNWLDSNLKIAKPHLLNNNELVQLNDENIDNMGPAGSIYSSVSDMSKWIIEFLSLENDSIESRLPKNVLKKIRKPYQLKGFRRSKDQPEQLRFLFSGMGWSISDEFGHLTYTHDGGTGGFKSELMIIPEKGFGAIVLTNSRSHQFSYALVKEIQQALYQKEPLNINDLLFTEFQKEKEKSSKEKNRIEGLKKTQISNVKKTSFSGMYHNTVYGTIEIRDIEQRSKIYFLNHQNNLNGMLVRLNENEYIIEFESSEFDYMQITFAKQNGVIAGFNLDAASSGDEYYYFKKQYK